MSVCAKLLDNYLDYSEYELGHRQKTLSTNRYLLYRFLNFLPADFDLRNISEEIFYDYLHHMKENNCSENTILHNRTVIMGFLKYLHRRGDIAKLFKPESRKPERKLYRVLSANEMFKLCRSADDTSTFLGIRNRTILEIAFSAGLRIGEILTLEVNDVSLEDRYFKIYGKGGHERYGMICDQAKYWINRYLELRAEQNVKTKYLFFSATKKQLDHSALVRILDKAVKKSQLKGHITFHTIRRSFATILWENGMDVCQVQHLLGHKSIETTMLYIVYQTKAMKKAYELHPGNLMRIAKTDKQIVENEVDKSQTAEEITVIKKEKSYQVEIDDKFYKNPRTKLADSDLFKKFAPLFYQAYGEQLVNNWNGFTTSQVMLAKLKSYGLTYKEINKSVEILKECYLIDIKRTTTLKDGQVCMYYKFPKPDNVKITETIIETKVTEVPKKNMLRVRKGYQIKFSDELIGKIDPLNFKMPDVLLALNKIYFYYGNKLLAKCECSTSNSSIQRLLAEFNYTAEQSEDFTQVLLKSGIVEFKHFGSTPLDRIYTLKKIKGIIIRRDKTQDV